MSEDWRAALTALDPSPFTATLPYQLRVWDNTALQTAMHCWRHHWYSTVRGLRSNGGSVHLDFGSLIHTGADVWTKGRALGLNHADALDAALEKVLGLAWPEGAERDIFGGYIADLFQCTDRTRTVRKKGITRCSLSYRPNLGASEGVCAQCLYPVDTWREYVCVEKTKNLHSLLRGLVALCDHLEASNIRAMRLEDGRIGSELRWFHDLPLLSPDLAPYLMTGSYDGAALEGSLNLPVGPEYKTTQRPVDERYWAGMRGSPQVLTYTWAGTKDFGSKFRVLYLVLQISAAGVEIVPKRIYLTPDQLNEYQDDMLGIVQEAELRARMAEQVEAEGGDPSAAFPRRLSACQSLPGAATTPCPFRDFCAMPRADRADFIDAAFHVEHWNALAKDTPPTPENEDA
jgi:hypothetical protein